MAQGGGRLSGGQPTSAPPLRVSLHGETGIPAVSPHSWGTAPSPAHPMPSVMPSPAEVTQGKEKMTEEGKDPHGPTLFRVMGMPSSSALEGWSPTTGRLRTPIHGLCSRPVELEHLQLGLGGRQFNRHHRWFPGYSRASEQLG